MRILIILIAVLANTTLLGQGLIFDSISFKEQQEYPIDRAALPTQSSLEIYLPAFYMQSGGTCVAMSLALARTIMFARANKITDKATITKNQMSPYFLYYYGRNKNDFECSEGMNPIVALKVAKEIGFEKMIKIEYPNHYPYTANYLCPNNYDFLPPETELHLKNARSFRISDFFVMKSLTQIKSALSKGFPVILAMQIPESFDKCNSTNWQSKSDESRNSTTYGHAMVAVGYDDNLNGGSIRIANSWGPKWADNGKVWIKYSEFEYWLDGAFVMVAPTSTYRSEPNEQISKYKLPKKQTFKASAFNGKFDFNNEEYIRIFSENNK